MIDMYSLYAYDPTTGEYLTHKGDAGGMSMILWAEDGKIKFEHNAKPRIGFAIRVGAVYGRTFSDQDWWQTSTIKKIIEEYRDDNDHLNVKFRTRNSYYHWIQHS